MVIERNKDEVVIRLSSKISNQGLEQLIDYLSYLEIAKKSKAKKADLDSLVSVIKKERKKAASKTNN